MHNWLFTMATLEGGTVCIKVKAKDKQSAIRKGFAAIESMNFSITPHWDCRLMRN